MATESKAAQDEAPPQLTPEELEKKINDLDKRLSAALSKLGQDTANDLSDMSGKLNSAVNDMKKIKAKAEGNENRLAAVESTQTTLTTDVGKVRNDIKNTGSRLDAIEEFQGQLNTAIFKGLQEGKDFTLAEVQAAKKHTDDVADVLRGEISNATAPLEQRITAVENAPVKQHTHKLHITLDGQTGGPDGGGKS